MTKLTLKNRLLAWIATKADRVSVWATERAFRSIENEIARSFQYGARVYSIAANMFEDEAMRHNPMSLCRSYGLRRQRECIEIADGIEANEKRRLSSNEADPNAIKAGRVTIAK